MIEARKITERENRIRETFAKRLADARAEADLTQAELAELIRVGPMIVSRWERGAALPSSRNLAALSLALNKAPSYFLGSAYRGNG